MPIQEPQRCQLCGADAGVLSLWPFWCLDSLENNYYYTTVQTHTASSPNPRASAHGTVQRRALSHGPALNHRIKIIRNKKYIWDKKYTLTWDYKPAPKHVAWTYSAVMARPALCTKSQRRDSVSTPPSESSSTTSHSAPQKKKRTKAKLKIYTSPDDEIIYVWKEQKSGKQNKLRHAKDNVKSWDLDTSFFFSLKPNILYVRRSSC